MVQALLCHPSELLTIKEILETIDDLQSKIASFIRFRLGILSILRLILELRNALEASKRIYDLVLRLECSIYDDILGAFQNANADGILSLIDQAVDVVPNGKLNEFQICHVLKSDGNPLLDVARRTLQETTDDIVEYSETLISQYALEGKLKYSNANRFILVLKNPTPNQTKHFIKVGTSGFTTLPLQKLNERIKESMEEITSLSEKITEDLKEEIAKSVGILYVLCEALALLDFTCSLATYALQVDAVKPIIKNTRECFVNEGKHPLIVNSIPITYSTGGFERFAVIVGPNRSGKSTLLRQIVLYQIMVGTSYYGRSN
jgi:DNA mismatch repair protein MSH4